MVAVSWDPRATAVWQVSTGGTARLANGSTKVGAPVCAAGWMFSQPLQLPTICVFAAPVVVMVPPPFVVIAAALFELTYTPQPLFRVTLPLRTIETAVGLRVRTQP